ncbi:unnamed protein product [Sphagnum jensenii]
MLLLVEEYKASDQTCFVAVAVASLLSNNSEDNNTYLAVGLDAAVIVVAVVAGSPPLATRVAAGSVEMAERVPVTAVTGLA